MSGFVRVCFMLCSSVVALAAQAGDSGAARSWLERMAQSLSSRNYDGRFIHSSDTQSETLRIVHRSDGGKVIERLVSLDGSGREFIRTNTELTCYMPDKRTVLVESRSDSDALLALIPSYREGLEAYYDISMGQSLKVLGRKAQLITVQPRDDYRYGYRLWLDSESAMPLKSQLFDRYGRVIEQMAFAELKMLDAVADADLAPTVEAKGYQWIRHEIRKRTIPKDSIDWHVENLPPGFTLKVIRLQPVAGSDTPARHLVYSDGLATVSLFIEQQSAAGEHVTGFQKVGSTFAFVSSAQGYQVTGVGEVPAVTIQTMVKSLVHDAKK